MSIARLGKPEHALHREPSKLQCAIDALSNSQYRTLTESQDSGLGIFDENDAFLFANHRLCDLLGYSEDELTGRSLTDFSDAGGRMAPYLKEPRNTGAGLAFELVWARKDGTRVSTNAELQGLFDHEGAFRGNLGVFIPSKAGQGERKSLSCPLLLQTRFHEVLEAQEAERRRVSRDLHDEVGQALTVLKLNVGLLGRALGESQFQLKEDCGDIIACIDHVLEHVRRLARELSPSILEDVGLSAALRALLQDFERSTHLKISAVVGDLDGLLPNKAGIMVYRIVQEALANVACHAKANSVTVVGHDEGSWLSFLVEDDGIGFDSDQVLGKAVPGGLGIALIGERVRMLGGTLELSSGIGKGTRIRFVIPTSGERDDGKAV